MSRAKRFVPFNERHDSKAERSMEANNLLIGQICVNMLERREAFDGLEHQTGLTREMVGKIVEAK